jgi:hypothetical protein
VRDLLIFCKGMSLKEIKYSMVLLFLSLLFFHFIFFSADGRCISGYSVLLFALNELSYILVIYKLNNRDILQK